MKANENENKTAPFKINNVQRCFDVLEWSGAMRLICALIWNINPIDWHVLSNFLNWPIAERFLMMVSFKIYLLSNQIFLQDIFWYSFYSEVKVALFNCTAHNTQRNQLKTNSLFKLFIQTNDCIMQFNAFRNILIWLKLAAIHFHIEETMKFIFMNEHRSSFFICIYVWTSKLTISSILLICR